VVARIYLLLRTVNEISGHEDTKTYNLGQTAVGPFNDGYYRRVFQTTVLLRNSEVYKF
jgi:type IV pilus assembly protein PilW